MSEKKSLKYVILLGIYIFFILPALWSEIESNLKQQQQQQNIVLNLNGSFF